MKWFNRTTSHLLLFGLGGWMILFVAFGLKKEEKKNPNDLVYKMIEKKVPIPEIHEVLGTFYNPTKWQCDNDPLITADNSKINLKKLKNEEIRWVALSRDLLKRWGGPFDYGDTLTVHHPNSMIRGKWVVHDSMNKRWRKRIDFLVHKSTRFPGKSKHVLISNSNYYISRK